MVPQLGKVDEMGLLRLKPANQRLMWKSLLSPSPPGEKKQGLHSPKLGGVKGLESPQSHVESF